MSIQLTLSAFLHLLAVILGGLVSVILLNYARAPRLAMNKWLGASILSLSFGLFVGFLVESDIAFQFPHVYRTGNITALVYMPLSYLYFRMVIEQRAPTRRDLLHGLPMLFYIVDYLPFFLLPASPKLEILRSDVLDLNCAPSYDEGWLTPPYFHLALRTIQFAVYWCLQINLLRKVYKLDIPLLERENRYWLRWVKLYIGIQSLTFLPFFFVVLLAQWSYIFFATHVFAGIMLIFSTLLLFFQPDILYGIRGIIIYRDTSVSGNGNGQIKNLDAGGAYLDAGTVQMLREKLDILMTTTTPFLKHGYSSIELAKDLDIPPYQLSAFLNQSLGANFNDFINERRIRYCVEQLNKGEWKDLTIEGIGYQCGFSNRNTFTSAFKKFTGQTPSAYLRMPSNSELHKN